MDRESSLQKLECLLAPKTKQSYLFLAPLQWPWQGCCWNKPRECNAVRRSCVPPPPYRHYRHCPPPPTIRQEHSLGIIFFSSLSSCQCCIFLQFYLHFTTDYTCMIVYVTNNKEPEPEPMSMPLLSERLSFPLSRVR